MTITHGLIATAAYLTPGVALAFGLRRYLSVAGRVVTALAWPLSVGVVVLFWLAAGIARLTGKRFDAYPWEP